MAPQMARITITAIVIPFQLLLLMSTTGNSFQMIDKSINFHKPVIYLKLYQLYNKSKQI